LDNSTPWKPAKPLSIQNNSNNNIFSVQVVTILYVPACKIKLLLKTAFILSCIHCSFQMKMQCQNRNNYWHWCNSLSLSPELMLLQVQSRQLNFASQHRYIICVNIWNITVKWLAFLYHICKALVSKPEASNPNPGFSRLHTSYFLHR
jgi:hypothetical protein